MDQSRLRRVLSMIVAPMDPKHLTLAHQAPAKTLQTAAAKAFGVKVPERYMLSYREALGLIGAQEMREKGIKIQGLSQRIEPHWGVFAPTHRDHYIQIFSSAMSQLDRCAKALEVGTGTGVLSLLLLETGVVSEHITATDICPRAVRCAEENAFRFGHSSRTRFVQSDLFENVSGEKYNLIVFNPPFIPARPSGVLDVAVFDDKHIILEAFLAQAANYLEENGKIVLLNSTLPELCGLRDSAYLTNLFSRHGFQVSWTTRAKVGDAKTSLLMQKTDEELLIFVLSRIEIRD